MLCSFKNILVPVDLSTNTEVAIKKGIELADAGSTIYLVFILNNSLPDLFKRRSFRLVDYSLIDSRLLQWKSTIENCHSYISVCTWILVDDNIQLAIEKKSMELKIDLIIVAKSSHHSWFPFLNTLNPSEIVNRTGISVLTVKPGSIYQKFRNIVVPVSNEMARNKLVALDMLSRKFYFKIYLVTFRNSNKEATEALASTLLQTYYLVKRTIRFPVQYAMLDGANNASAILNYAAEVNADSLLLYPETETKMRWMNRHISDMLIPKWKVHVLTINPGPI